MQIDTDSLKELIQKVADGMATQEEKLKALRDINAVIEEYNKALKKGISTIAE